MGAAKVVVVVAAAAVLVADLIRMETPVQMVMAEVEVVVRTLTSIPVVMAALVL